MFSTLIESAPRPDRRTLQGLLSLVLHAALGVGAVEASRRTTVPAPGGPRVDTMVYVVAPAPVTSAQPVASVAPLFEPLSAVPVPVAAPVIVPTGIPPVEPGAPVDPRRFVLQPATAGCVACSPGTSGAEPASVFTAASVDTPVEVLEQGSPSYPPFLRAAGLDGRVVVRYVVDTLGRVEAGSITVDEATHPGFAASAREAVQASRFRPAVVGGRRVRQLVLQAIRFRIE